MRKVIILVSAFAMTGCATIPQHNVQHTTQEKTKQYHATQLVQSLLILGAVAYVANEVADKNRNKQCTNGKVLYRGVGNERYFVCP
jgi:starvation-inducible outer membrane lipoprotein